MTRMRDISRFKALRSGGYTLIEIMVVVALIGVIIGLTVPAAAGYFQRRKLEGARSALMSDIAYARSMAISRRTTFQLIFDGDKYRIENAATNAVVRRYEAPPGITYTADANPNFFAYGLSEATNIAVEGNGNTSAVQLLPNGTVTHD